VRGQGRIYKRGSIYWIAYYHRGAQVRESTHSTRENVALKLLRERLRTAGTPQFVGPRAERVTFDTLAELYLTDYRVNGKRSLRDAERNVRHLRGAFDGDRALDITADRIARYTAARREADVKPATVNRELAALRRMFSLACKAGMLSTRPYIAMLDELQNIREGFLEPSEFGAVCAELPPHLADAATFAYLSGWRKGEICTLTWADVDLRANVIRLRVAHSKNKRPRTLVLRGDLLALFERRAAERRLDCPFVFHGDGKPLGNFRKAWTLACQAAGVQDRLFHDLRRSAVRNLVRAGTPERVAMAISGHKTRSIFDRYNITSEEDLAAAMERTQAYVAEASQEPPKVRPLALAAGERAQNAHNPAKRAHYDLSKEVVSA
jgi:integrase